MALCDVAGVSFARPYNPGMGAAWCLGGVSVQPEGGKELTFDIPTSAGPYTGYFPSLTLSRLSQNPLKLSHFIAQRCMVGLILS